MSERAVSSLRLIKMNKKSFGRVCLVNLSQADLRRRTFGVFRHHETLPLKKLAYVELFDYCLQFIRKVQAKPTTFE